MFETGRSNPGPDRKDSFLWSQFIKSSIKKECRGKRIQGQYFVKSFLKKVSVHVQKEVFYRQYFTKS